MFKHSAICHQVAELQLSIRYYSSVSQFWVNSRNIQITNRTKCKKNSIHAIPKRLSLCFEEKSIKKGLVLYACPSFEFCGKRRVFCGL